MYNGGVQAQQATAVQYDSEGEKCKGWVERAIHPRALAQLHSIGVCITAVSALFYTGTLNRKVSKGGVRVACYRQNGSSVG